MFKLLMSKFTIFLFVLALLPLGGCAIDGKLTPPSPPEVKLIVNQGLLLTLRSRDVDVQKAAQLQTIFEDSRSVLLTALKEDPTNVDQVRVQYLDKYGSEYAELANTVLQVLLFRLRPAIDQGKTDLAAQYLEAALDGAINATNIYMMSKTEQAYFHPPNAHACSSCHKQGVT